MINPPGFVSSVVVGVPTNNQKQVLLVVGTPGQRQVP
jgi:hypothetical protein